MRKVTIREKMAKLKSKDDEMGKLRIELNNHKRNEKLIKQRLNANNNINLNRNDHQKKRQKPKETPNWNEMMNEPQNQWNLKRMIMIIIMHQK